ncbi:hypothetical protein [Aliiroseovarius sp. xm-m-339-2]|uniref:hypothetical protein n=1 Tax=Aliiroseovarius sp. xm-m-339-2 TaxID=2651829 RepID=UPI001569FC6B|nr:hypothetical protein [Aliiroseovarius sp. xm-m-339-2]NRP42782.1 hypothetical protein [Aliiroseovarius sp. xm-m-339-2]
MAPKENMKPEGGLEWAVSETPHSQQFRQLARVMGRELFQASRVARQATARVHGGGGFHARRSERAYRRFISVMTVLLVFVPAVVSGLYYFAYASAQYVTESHFSISTQNSSLGASLSGIFGGAATSEGTTYVIEYLQSAAALKELEREIDMQALYGGADIDLLARLRARASIEQRLKYWKKMVNVSRERFTEQIKLTVRAFSPEDSLRIHQSLLNAAENTVNLISQRQRTVRLQEAERGVIAARATLETAIEALQNRREQLGVLDVEVTMQSFEEILSTLRLESANLEQTLALLLQLAPGAYQINTLRARRQAVEKHIAEFEEYIASDRQGETSLAVRAAELDLLEIDIDVARRDLITRMAALEDAHSQVEDQTSFLQTSVNPVMPEEALYPARLKNWLISVVLSIGVWGAVVGLAGMVHNHRS